MNIKELGEFALFIDTGIKGYGREPIDYNVKILFKDEITFNINAKDFIRIFSCGENMSLSDFTRYCKADNFPSRNLIRISNNLLYYTYKDYMWLRDISDISYLEVEYEKFQVKNEPKSIINTIKKFLKRS